MPLAPSGLSGVGVSVERTSKRRQLGGGGDAVVGEVGGQRVAVGVVADLLVQRLADARRDAAVLLALDEQRVEDRAAVVDGDVAQRARTSPVSRSTSTTAMWAPNGNVASPWSNSPSARDASAVAELGGARRPGGELGPRQRAMAGTPATPTVPGVGVDDDVGDVGLEQVGGEAACAFVDQRLGGLVHRRAAELQRPGSARAAAPRHEVGVAVDEADPLDRDAGAGR